VRFVGLSHIYFSDMIFRNIDN